MENEPEVPLKDIEKKDLVPITDPDFIAKMD